MSPHGTLFVALARHSLGGTDCRKCSIAGKSSTGSRSFFSRSCGMFRASFQTHFSTSSATLASCESGEVPLLGNGLTICKSNVNRALKDEYQYIESDCVVVTGKVKTTSAPKCNWGRCDKLMRQPIECDVCLQLLLAFSFFNLLIDDLEMP